jgi:hypothetical protein
MDEVAGDRVPLWHDHVRQYAAELAALIDADYVIEAFNAGKSFEAELARARYTKNGLSVIIEFTESSELFVDDDAKAVEFAFSKADPFDGAPALLAIEKCDRHTP